jgi:pyruvate dehydrogenase E2 component (dihydrolipoamide acetyltransferase)
VPTPIEVRVPDIGGFSDVSVIDVLVEQGQRIEKESPLITLETEKAAMDVPAPAAGRVADVKLKRGDKVSQGSLILLLEGEDAPAAAPSAPAPTEATPTAAPTAAAAPAPKPASTTAAAAPAGPGPATAPPAPSAAPSRGIDEMAFSSAHASPAVRKFARELGVDLGKVSGTGPKARITVDDVKAQVKQLLASAAASASVAGPSSAGGGALPRVPVVDFAKFGPVEVQPLGRIQRISGARLQASWLNVPHVTQHDDADITDLEVVRAGLKEKATTLGVRLTPLAFIVRACVLALKEFPRFNSSLDAAGENLVLKRYYNIGFAADTPNGLVVPVIAGADRMDIYEIARALGAASEKARSGKLTAAEMQGGTFTISSLGGIGGTAFTPIVNAPEVAILGVSRSGHKPVYLGGTFLPRLILPLSLSYDHRVIDGAAAARFTVYLAKVLGDVRALV